MTDDDRSVKTGRRGVLGGMAGTAALVAIGGRAGAQGAYPTHPVRMVVGFPAGGVTDVAARIVAQPMGDRLGQPMVIENKPGAAGNIAADQVAKAPGDGYAILLGTNASHGVNPALYQNLPFDPIKDFAPIGLVATITNVLVVHPSVPAKSVAELIALAKAQPGKLNFGSAAIGSAGHLVGEMFKMRTGVDIVHVPYRGAAPMQTDLLAGRLQMSFATLQTVMAPVEAGQLRALAVTAPARIPRMAQVPTLSEAVGPGFVADAWFALFAPAGTPADIVTKLNAALNHSLSLADVRDKLAAQGFAVSSGTPAELARFVAAEVPRWAEVVRISGAKAE